MSSLYFAIVLCLAVPCALTLTCHNNAYINGCSVPLGLPFYYKSVFTPACNKHDICYDCAVNFGLTRLDCDLIFLGNMKIECRYVEYAKRFECNDYARLYFKTVDEFGEGNFQKTPPSWCRESWVTRCMT